MGDAGLLAFGLAPFGALRAEGFRVQVLMLPTQFLQ